MNHSHICKGQWTRTDPASGIKSQLDYVIASNSIAHGFLEMQIDEEGLYRPTGKVPTDHNSIIFTVKSLLPKVSNVNTVVWNIRCNTNWEDYQSKTSELLLNQRQSLEAIPSTTQRYKSWLRLVKGAAITTIGRQKLNKHATNNPLPSSPEIRAAQLRRNTTKTLYSQAIQTRAHHLIQAALDEYKSAQRNLQQAVEDASIIQTEKTLCRIAESGGMNSKLFWNLIRKLKRPNSEDLLPIMKEDGAIIYNESEVKEYTRQYYSNLFSQRHNAAFTPEWTTYVGDHVQGFLSRKDLDNHPLNRPFSLQEVCAAIKESRHKANRSPGPDSIPYEFLFNGGPEMNQSLHDLFNHIYVTEEIPSQWSEALICNIGKGKKVDPEKLSSKRGISLSSNVGKIFEKVIFNRISGAINYSEAQAGARKNRGCTDQIFIFQSIVQQRTSEGKLTFVAFLDLEKAYDKVWRDGLFYALWNKGIQGKMWRLMYYLNSNLSAKIRTKFGLTDAIKILESIRQGGVLSGPEFAALIDEEEFDLQQLKKGVLYYDLLIASLLLMDDILLIADSPQDLQDMLDVSYQYACRYHHEFGLSKCNVMIMNDTNHTYDNATWKLGPFSLSVCFLYRWLGINVTPDISTNRQHIDVKRQLTTAALQSCLAASSNDVINKIKVQALTRIHLQSIVPSLAYGTECLNFTKKDLESIEQIQLNALRMILKVPKSTPRISLLAETGCLPMEIVIHKRKLMYLHSLLCRPDHLCGKVLRIQMSIFSSNQQSFYNKCLTLLHQYNLPTDPEVISKKSKTQWKYLIKKSATAEANRLYATQSSLKKLRFITPYKKVYRLEMYFTLLNRQEAIAIFRLRTGMMKLKANFKSQYTSLRCDRCPLGEVDDENHLLTCSALSELRCIYQVNSLNDAFHNNPQKHQLRSIASFLLAVNQIL